jgi:hypothetical protein
MNMNKTHSSYTGELEVDVPAETAWAALEGMAEWLPQLPTVGAVEATEGVSGPAIVLQAGHPYLVRTAEGPVMRCCIVEADQEKGVVRIEAHLGPLRSRLRCTVRSAAPGACVIGRQQSYLGVVGRLFTMFFGKRERDETHAYLRAWAGYALGILGKRHSEE